MPDISFTPEQQAHIDGLIKKSGEDAVTKFKTESEDARKKSIPEKYEFKFSDNTPLDSKTDAEKIAATARKLGLTAEQAADFLRVNEDVAGGIVARQKQSLTDQSAKWKTEVESDKDLGGANLATTNANIHRVMERFAPGDAHALRKVLNDTGYGNHPAWVRFVNAIGKAMAEDGPTGGFGGGSQTKPDHEIVYGSN